MRLVYMLKYALITGLQVTNTAVAANVDVIKPKVEETAGKYFSWFKILWPSSWSTSVNSGYD